MSKIIFIQTNQQHNLSRIIHDNQNAIDKDMLYMFYVK